MYGKHMMIMTKYHTLLLLLLLLLLLALTTLFTLAYDVVKVCMIEQERAILH
jgi:hypothetical protein